MTPSEVRQRCFQLSGTMLDAAIAALDADTSLVDNEKIMLLEGATAVSMAAIIETASNDAAANLLASLLEDGLNG